MRFLPREADKCIKPESFDMTKSAYENKNATSFRFVLPIRETIEVSSITELYALADKPSFPKKYTLHLYSLKYFANSIHFF